MRDTIDMAREAGFADEKGTIHAAYQLKAFEALVRADERSVEREACAKLIEAYIVPGMAREMARIIRARGTND
jgi:hypothetical protein